MKSALCAKLLTCAATIAVVVMTGGAAVAQMAQSTQTPQSSSSGIETVTVTATRRAAEDVSSVPMDITAFSGTELSNLHIQSVQDLSKISPSLNVVSYGASAQQIVIRGISSNVGQTTGLYLDEAPLLGGFNGNVPGDSTPALRFHDINRVEVLDGPQGTLFGSSSMDGTVRIITNKPNLSQFSASVDATGAAVDGGNAFFNGDVVLNVPIVEDSLGIRLVGWGESGGGYIDQTIEGTTRKNINDEHLYGGRITLLWEPINHLTITGSINYQHLKVNGAQFWTERVGYVGPGGPQGMYSAYNDYLPTQTPYRGEYTLYDLTAQYDLGFGSIIASTTYGRKTLLDTEDTSAMACLYYLCRGTPIYPNGYTSSIQFSDQTDELRFSSNFSGPVQLVAGAYYERDIKDYSGAVIVGDQATGLLPCTTYVLCAAAGLIQPGFGNSPVVYAFSEHYVADQYALYGQLDYRILPELTATVGARYFSASLSDRQLQQEDVYPDFIFGIVTVPYYRPGIKSDESKSTYNFSLLWRPTDDLSFYGRIASGFRVGGINNAAALAAQQGVTLPDSYSPDSLWDYEVGAKVYLIDRRLFLNLSAYHMDWSKQQLNALAFGTYNYEINAGKTTTNGFTLSADFQPTTGLTMAGSVNYVDATLDEDLSGTVVAGGTPGLKGDTLPNVPHFSFSGRAEYDHPFEDGITGYVGTDFNYRGDSKTAFRAVTPAQISSGVPDNFIYHVPSYFLLNLRAGVRFDNYDISIFCRNVTNKVIYAGVLSDLSGTRVYSVTPRMVGIRLSAAF